MTEINALMTAMKDKLERLKVRAFGNEGELNICELKPAPGNFNLYGRIIFRKKRVVPTTTGCCMSPE